MLRNAYYSLKPWIPRRVQMALRRLRLVTRRKKYADVWPIDEQTGRAPPDWPGWPDGKRFALVLTHDVESRKGHDRCLALAELEQELGFRSSFNFVPEGYEVSAELRAELEKRGFEVGVHGLVHDGKLFKSRRIWQQRAARINDYLESWNAVGFRAPAMHHNLAWLRDLDALYDASTFDTDPFEPQPDGCGTIFPFRVEASGDRPGYVELPYTLPQDFTAFILLKDEGLDIWKQKLAWIAQRGGMAMLIAHPDYMAFGPDEPGSEEYPTQRYRDFLAHIQATYPGQYWHALPREVAAYCQNDESLVRPARRLHVCMVAYTFYERDNRVMRYAEALVRRGDRVDVVALNSGGRPREEWTDGVRVLRIQGRALDEKAQRTYLWRLFRFLFRAMAVVGARHARDRYDLVHTHNIPDFHVFTALVPRLTGAKVILDIHDVVPELYASKFNADPNAFTIRMLRGVERISSAFAHHVIIANHIWEKTLVARSVRPDKITTMMNCPDTAIFTRRHSVSDRDGPFVLCYPGTLSWHQGVDVTVRAVARIRDDVPNLEFHIYGGGDQLQFLQSLVNDLHLEDRVLFKGHFPLKDLARLMGASDLGVVAKRKNSFGNEAFSTKIFEFMATGVPVVASDTKIDTYYFNDEIITFFRSEDETDLAAKLLQLYRDPDRRRRQAEAAMEFVQQYSWVVKRADYYRLVDGLTSARRVSVPA